MSESLGSQIKSIAATLYPHYYSVAGVSSLEAAEVFSQFLPFHVSRYDSGSSLRGWRIPHGWGVRKALIRHHGRVVFDCIKDTPLGCAYLSPCFHGVVDKATLLEHSAYRVDLPDAVVYDWTRIYRPSISSWGLSLPWNTISSLPDYELEIDIQTETYHSSMAVLDYVVKGASSQEVIINAHNCHPFQANDDISGCAVAIKLFQILSARADLKYTYRLLIAPELFGPMFWLDSNRDLLPNISSCILLKSVGNDSFLKVQSSFDANALINRVVSKASSDISDSPVESHPYRSYYGNDETVFEAPGFEIPTVTLTRYPFPEYHTNLDKPALLSTDKLSETLEVIMQSIHILETNFELMNPPDGLYCLSHPDYDLYKTAVEPGISDAGRDIMSKSWNLLMNNLPRHCSRGITALEASCTYNLPYDPVLDYFLKWSAKGLSQAKPIAI